MIEFKPRPWPTFITLVLVIAGWALYAQHMDRRLEAAEQRACFSVKHPGHPEEDKTVCFESCDSFTSMQVFTAHIYGMKVEGRRQIHLRAESVGGKKCERMDDWSQGDLGPAVTFTQTDREIHL